MTYFGDLRFSPMRAFNGWGRSPLLAGSAHTWYAIYLRKYVAHACAVVSKRELLLEISKGYVVWGKLRKLSNLIDGPRKAISSVILPIVDAVDCGLIFVWETSNVSGFRFIAAVMKNVETDEECWGASRARNRCSSLNDLYPIMGTTRWSMLPGHVTVILHSVCGHSSYRVSIRSFAWINHNEHPGAHVH